VQAPVILLAYTAFFLGPQTPRILLSCPMSKAVRRRLAPWQPAGLTEQIRDSTKRSLFRFQLPQPAPLPGPWPFSTVARPNKRLLNSSTRILRLPLTTTRPLALLGSFISIILACSRFPRLPRAIALLLFGTNEPDFRTLVFDGNGRATQQAQRLTYILCM